LDRKPEALRYYFPGKVAALHSTLLRLNYLPIMQNDYKVKLEVFEGPLDLLLYLIKKEEVDIYDIPIERITKQYLDYLQMFKILDLDVAGEFVVMAANLIYIKSRSLLPVDQQPPEESAEEEDPRWELVRQLIEYKKFKDAKARD
jgi:segregation and condensation protein A